jgi:hypothetical protein
MAWFQRWARTERGVSNEAELYRLKGELLLAREGARLQAYRL